MSGMIKLALFYFFCFHPCLSNLPSIINTSLLTMVSFPPHSKKNMTGLVVVGHICSEMGISQQTHHDLEAYGVCLRCNFAKIRDSLKGMNNYLSYYRGKEKLTLVFRHTCINFNCQYMRHWLFHLRVSQNCDGQSRRSFKFITGHWAMPWNTIEGYRYWHWGYWQINPLACRMHKLWFQVFYEKWTLTFPWIDRR